MNRFAMMTAALASLAAVGCGGQYEGTQERASAVEPSVEAQVPGSGPDELSGAGDGSAESALICDTCDTGDPAPPPSPTPALPDFVLLSNYVVKYNSTLGYYTITFTIKNAGTASGFCGATAVSVQKDDGTSLAYWNVLTGATLAAGATKTVEQPIGVNSPWIAGSGNSAGAPYLGDTLTSPSPYKVVAKVDTWSQTTERYESNNTRTFDF